MKALADFLSMLKAAVELIGGLRQPVVSMVLQPLATVLLLIVLYAGWHVQNEGDLRTGLRVAFLDTRASRAARDHEFEVAILRAELYQAAESDRLVDQLLSSVLQRAPQAARVRLAVVHNGVTGLTGIGLLRYDITNAVAAPGHTAGMALQNQPLSEWSMILPPLLAGRCELSTVDGVANPASKARLLEMGTIAVLACPVSDVHGTVLGALFVLWDRGDTPPCDEELVALKAYTQRVGAQIAAALDLLVPNPRLGHVPRRH
jgi:hypothetical protein